MRPSLNSLTFWGGRLMELEDPRGPLFLKVPGLPGARGLMGVGGGAVLWWMTLGPQWWS